MRSLQVLRGGIGGGARVVAGVEAAAVVAQAEAAAGGRHELQRPHRAGARAGVHLAVGFLRHDPEQQRFRQAVLLERRRHQVLHVAVVLVAVHQRRPHVGEPAADAGLHRRVELHHLHEALAFLAEQRGGVGGIGHVHVVAGRIRRWGRRRRPRRWRRRTAGWPSAAARRWPAWFPPSSRAASRRRPPRPSFPPARHRRSAVAAASSSTASMASR